MGPSSKNSVKFLALVILLIVLWYCGRNFQIDTSRIENALLGMPLIGSSVIYIFLYVVVTFFVFFSKDIFWIIGAVVFGSNISTLLITISEIINAFILFFLARYLGRNFVESYLKRKSETLPSRLGNLSFFWLFMLRAVPLIPYRFMDLGFGLTGIQFSRYLAAVVIATPIKTFWMQYILAGVGRGVLNDPRTIVDFLLHNKTLYLFSFVYLVLLVLVAIKFKDKIFK